MIVSAWVGSDMLTAAAKRFWTVGENFLYALVRFSKRSCGILISEMGISCAVMMVRGDDGDGDGAALLFDVSIFALGGSSCFRNMAICCVISSTFLALFAMEDALAKDFSRVDILSRVRTVDIRSASSRSFSARTLRARASDNAISSGVGSATATGGAATGGATGGVGSTVVVAAVVAMGDSIAVSSFS